LSVYLPPHAHHSVSRGISTGPTNFSYSSVRKIQSLHPNQVYLYYGANSLFIHVVFDLEDYDRYKNIPTNGYDTWLDPHSEGAFPRLNGLFQVVQTRTELYAHNNIMPPGESPGIKYLVPRPWINLPRFSRNTRLVMYIRTSSGRCFFCRIRK